MGRTHDRSHDRAQPQPPKAQAQALALHLADALELGWCPVESEREMAAAAAELRRLHALNGDLLAALRNISEYPGAGSGIVVAARVAIARASAYDPSAYDPSAYVPNTCN